MSKSSDIQIIKKGVAKLLRLHEVGKSNISVEKACSLCLEAKRNQGVREQSLDTCKKSFKSMCDFMGDKSIQSVLPKDILEWLAAHPDWSPKTRENNRKYAVSLFTWLVGAWKLQRNPCDGMKPIKVPIKPAKILPVSDLEKLLHTCQKHDVAFLGWMCPVIFGGLRAAESRRMLDKNVGQETIDLNAGEQTKLNRRRAFEFEPVFKRWMELPGVKIEPMTEAEQTKRLNKIKLLAGVVAPKNSLRKSCASYWVKLKGAKEAARILGHSETVLFLNYANTTITTEEAKRFEALSPLENVPAEPSGIRDSKQSGA